MALATNVRMDQWDWDYFLTVRHEVLRQWPTGDELMDPATLDESVARQREQPWWKFASLRNEQAMKEDRLQLVPSCGHALVEQVSDHIHESEDLKPDRWHVFTDTYSRKCQFAKSQDAIERSRRDGFSYLNGYPIVLHGVAGARALNESTTVPLSTDGNDEDARLAWEIALAGGWTCGTIKSIEQVIQHSRDYPLELMIYNHQYIDRLTAYFNERGVPILRRDFANLSGWEYPWLQGGGRGDPRSPGCSAGHQVYGFGHRYGDGHGSRRRRHPSRQQACSGILRTVWFP